MFRTGMTTVTRRRSLEPASEGRAAERNLENRRIYGPLPYARWESLTDTATALREEDVTGDVSFPKTKADWNAQMEDLRGRLHRMCLGGVGPANLGRCHDRLDRDTCSGGGRRRRVRS